MDSVWNMKSFLTAFFFLELLFIVKGNLHCFKKMHESGPPGKSVCRGVIYKSRDRPFRSPNGCCRNGGVGYTEDPLVKMGKRGLKYECTLCPGAQLPPTTASPVAITTPSTVGLEGWSEWSAWSACSVTCMVGSRGRERTCYSTCSGRSTEQEPCVDAPDCPVDGAWGPWNAWSTCSATCDGGVRYRGRRCNDPVPSNGGLNCPDNAEEVEECAVQPCPVDGGWTDWVEYPCSSTCGKGIIVRNRTCTNPTPLYNGATCQGSSSKSEKCRGLPKCPINGGWTLWNEWGPCNASCGSGVWERVRECLAPKPKNKGADCVGSATDEETCYHPNPCPTDGGWSEWDPWGSCLAPPCTGERGNKTRKRTCNNPLPAHGGAMCEGSNNETQGCINNERCAVDGGWCQWSDYSACRPSNTYSFKVQTRECKCPQPDNGGLPCSGIDYQTENCLTDDEIRARCIRKQANDLEEDYTSSGYLMDDDYDTYYPC
ncbi:coadhesin-like [Watersipora subatra]|uniref:coadhesin-like n=1 Tax=Watersipora subatra TaxID=2589382 RepID=UPI00355BDBFE